MGLCRERFPQGTLWGGRVREGAVMLRRRASSLSEEIEDFCQLQRQGMTAMDDESGPLVALAARQASLFA